MKNWILIPVCLVLTGCGTMAPVMSIKATQPKIQAQQVKKIVAPGREVSSPALTNARNQLRTAQAVYAANPTKANKQQLRAKQLQYRNQFRTAKGE